MIGQRSVGAKACVTPYSKSDFGNHLRSGSNLPFIEAHQGGGGWMRSEGESIRIRYFFF